MNTTISQLFQ